MPAQTVAHAAAVVAAAALAPAFVAGSGVAQAAPTTEGLVSGTLALDDATWTIVSESEWSATDGDFSVEIVALPDTALGSPSERLIVSFQAVGTLAEAEVEDAAVTLRRNGTPLNADGGDAEIDLVTFEIENDSLVLGGNMLANLTPGDTADEIIQSAEDIVLQADFQATLFRDDG